MKKSLIILQEGNKDCGAACLLSIVRYFGGDISLERLINLTKTGKEGTSFYNLKEAAENIGLSAHAYVSDNTVKLSEISTPFIAQINRDNYMHFVVVYHISETKVLIMDPAKGKVIIDIFDFTNTWTGNIMLFEKIRSLPIYSNEKILNKTIINVLISNKKILIFLFILSLIFTFLSCLSSFYSQIIFDNVIDTTTSNLIIVTILFSILSIIKIITSYLRNYLIIYLNQKLDVSIILDTFSKIILLPFYYYKNKTTGEVLSRISDLFAVKGFISKVVVSFFIDSITFIVSSLILYFLSPRILFILLLIIFIYLIIIIIFNYPIKVLTRNLQEKSSLVNSFIVESINAYESIKGLNIEDNIILKFSKKYSYLLNTSYRKECVENLMILFKELVTDLGLLFVSYISIKFIINDTLSIGSYLNITLLSNYLIYPIRNIIDVLSEYHFIQSALLRANNLLGVEEENAFGNHLLKVEGNIVVNHLTYSYNNKYNVFEDISFNINKGDKVLILGSSGSGKSTIMKLIYKYYSCPRDRIYLNNYDLNDYSLSDIRKNITYISQNEIIFTGTIKDNIILGRDIGEEEFQKVVRITYTDEIVKDISLGYDYQLEENGANISGGQRERIILARSLLKNSNIIMIDEGLNEIDSVLERKILKNVFKEYLGKTFLIISHRKDNIDLYNRLIKLEDSHLKSYERGDL